MNRIQFRRDTASKWKDSNPTLMPGELGLELDTKMWKIGDGITPWKELDYTNDSSTQFAEAFGVLNIPEFNTNTAYLKNDQVKYNGDIYSFKENYGPASWDEHKVIKTPLLQTLKNLENQIASSKAILDYLDKNNIGKKWGITGEIFNDYDNNQAKGNYSHAEGESTTVNNIGEHAEGRFNKSTTNFTMSTIGIGTSNNNRKNAIEILNDGRIYIYGLGGYDGTNWETSNDLIHYINNEINSKLDDLYKKLNKTPN